MLKSGMLIIRPAEERDLPSVIKVLDESDHRYKKETFDRFFVAEVDGRIAGTVRLEEHDNFTFLTSLGVENDFRGQGIGAALMQFALKSAKNDMYIYTVIPDFFRKFGFTPLPTPGFLPAKDAYECDDCFPERCVTMVKKHDT